MPLTAHRLEGALVALLVRLVVVAVSRTGLSANKGAGQSWNSASTVAAGGAVAVAIARRRLRLRLRLLLLPACYVVVFGAAHAAVGQQLRRLVTQVYAYHPASVEAGRTCSLHLLEIGVLEASDRWVVVGERLAVAQLESLAGPRKPFGTCRPVFHLITRPHLSVVGFFLLLLGALNFSAERPSAKPAR